MVVLLTNLLSCFKSTAQSDFSKHTSRAFQSCSPCNMTTKDGFNIVYQVSFHKFIPSFDTASYAVDY